MNQLTESCIIIFICVLFQITNKKASMTTYLRDNLESYGPASNLMHNEKVREMIADGKPIYHFGFGQSPFPILDTAVESLKKHASKSAYLPVAGLYFHHLCYICTFKNYFWQTNMSGKGKKTY